MASIIIGSVPIHGHVTPLLGVARHFAARGDDVRFLTGARFASAVEAAGAEHLPLPPEADYDDRQDWSRVFPERARLKGTKAIAFDLENVFIRPGRGQYDALLAAHAARAADVVLVDPGFSGGAYFASLERRPPIVVCGVVPLPVGSRDTAPFGMGLPPARILNRARNRILAALADRIMAGPEAVAQQAHQELHGRPLPGSVMDWMGRAEAIAQFTVPAFEYPRSDAPPNLHFVGPQQVSASSIPTPDWWHELDGSRPVVHLTQGTIANRDWTQVVEPSLTALADEDVLVVVATGGRPLDTLPPLPANARAAEMLPYDELLPRTDVFVTNGGYGGVQEALRHGVPVVATGGKEDKPEVGARVAWSGIGRRIRSDRPSPRQMRRAIRAVLSVERYRARARELAEEVAAAPGLAGVEQIVVGLASGGRGDRATGAD
ncbi:MGT family glycosyltransferase [Nocardioides thalensis]|uniref:MGT family glycosyltransferase n=1 Tax=Nocardioides thalensis TaxID=1914755 RepID=A0A853C353_9ACTN|nr:glycosyltransferase [Nocardioides thalensis]NYJ01617.1 MGT family glycosyltransferase [Nocardioides thalensis]